MKLWEQLTTGEASGGRAVCPKYQMPVRDVGGVQAARWAFLELNLGHQWIAGTRQHTEKQEFRHIVNLG